MSKLKNHKNYSKMKKIVFWTSILTVLISLSVNAQNTQRVETREAVKQYFDQQIAPSLIAQQSRYINSLSEAEKAKLEEARQTMRSNFGNRQNPRGRGMKNTPNSRPCVEKVAEITANHPMENEAYKEFIEENSETWIVDIQAIHEENGVSQMKNKDGNTGPEFWIERFGTPEALLLMNPENPFNRGERPQRGKRAANKQGKSMVGNGRGNCAQPAKFNARLTPEQRAEMKAFVKEDVLPAIADERRAFDKNLSDEERQTIELARQKKEVRQAMFKAWHASEDFVPGARRDDPNFDNMRADMQESMQAVRAIALEHQAEIRASLDKIKSNETAWKENAGSIVGDRPQRGKKSNRMMFGKKWDTPMAFLLFNPDKAMASDVMDDNQTPFVTVFPNPVVSTGTVSISNAFDKNAELVLFTKEGTQLEVLFSGKINEDKFTVPFNTTQLENGIYIIKVDLGGELISRKVVIQH